MGVHKANATIHSADIYFDEGGMSLCTPQVLFMSQGYIAMCLVRFSLVYFVLCNEWHSVDHDEFQRYNLGNKKGDQILHMRLLSDSF